MAELLLVDDEPGIREGLAAVLRLRGHRVHCAATTLEARQSRDRHPVDLLLTDYKLPDGDGLTLLRDFRADTPQLPVLLMTGHASAALRQAFAALPGSRLIEKPIRPADVAMVVDRMLVDRRPPVPGDAVLAVLPVEERVYVRARLLGAGHDTCDRLSLVAMAASLCGGEPDITLADEGDQLRVEARWPDHHSVDLGAGRWVLELVGGDVQIESHGLRVGFPRRGAGVAGMDCTGLRPRSLADLTEPTAAAEPYNVAPWLRLLLELAGRPLRPTRTRAGGLPAELAALWR